MTQLCIKRAHREIFVKKLNVEKDQNISRKKKDKQENKNKNLLFILVGVSRTRKS